MLVRVLVNASDTTATVMGSAIVAAVTCTYLAVGCARCARGVG